MTTDCIPPERRLSEAIRLATQNPYEAGYRDGYAHGRDKARLPIEQRREVENILALDDDAQQEALYVLFDDINKYGRLVADQGSVIDCLLVALEEIERYAQRQRGFNSDEVLLWAQLQQIAVTAIARAEGEAE